MAPSLLLVASLASQAQASADGTKAQVIGGEKVKACGFPSVVSLDRGGMGCSGTLVHPKLVMTAAHCFMMGGTAKTVHFGERRGSRSRTAKVQKCVSHPNWKKTKEVGGTDIAYCLLAEEVKDVPITPILMGCETEILKKGTPVVIAGYGLTRPPWTGDEEGAKEPTPHRDGVKHWVQTRYIETLESGELKAAVVGSKGKQGCKGDSGGPVFVKLPEDKFGKEAGWRVFGVTSGQRSNKDPECTTGTGTYAMMHEWIATVEQETGLDLTPCFDADGTWNPGPECHSAPRELATTAAGSWPGSCESGPLTGKITTCGKQEGGDEPKGEKPKDKPKDDSKKKDGGSKSETPDDGSKGKKESPGKDDDKDDNKKDDDNAKTGNDEDPDSDDEDPPKKSGCTLAPGDAGGVMALSLLGLGLLRRRRRSAGT